MVEYGADINARDSSVQPHSVLDLALVNNKYYFASFLLENNVDESLVLKDNQERLEEIKETIAEERKLLQEANAYKRKRGRRRTTVMNR